MISYVIASKSSPSTIETKRPVTSGWCKNDALTFVNDKDFSPTPSRTRFPILLNLFDKCLHILYAQANASERMDCHSTNVTRSNPYENVLALQPTRIEDGGEQIPVDAVTATESGVFTYFLWRDLIISRRRTDLPVPSHISATKIERKILYAAMEMLETRRRRQQFVVH